MPNPNLDLLCSKLHLLQRHWHMETVTGKILAQSYQVFQVEVGLGGNIFAHPYSTFEGLSTMGWWKHMWQLCKFFGVDYRIHSRFDIPLLREDDKTVMDALCDLRIYSAAQWIRLNRVRKFKGVHTIGDMVLCDGRTLDPAIVTRGTSNSSRISLSKNPCQLTLDYGARPFTRSHTNHRSSNHLWDLSFLSHTDRTHGLQITPILSSTRFRGEAFMTCIPHGPPHDNPVSVERIIGKECPSVPSLAAYMLVPLSFATVW